MSSQSEQERERMKEEYKAHYRQIKEAKERLKQTEKKGKIAQALNNMNTDNLLESVDEFLGKVKDTVAFSEARLDVAMEGYEDDDIDSVETKLKQEELDEEIKKQKAKQTLKQVKAEMGMLYSEIEKHAEEIHAEKTIGTKKEEESDDDASSNEV